MKTNPFPPSMTMAVLAAALATGATLRAATAGQPAAGPQTSAAEVSPNPFETVAFSDSAEAMMMHQAYRILATGDHDYKGHRVKAMRQVEAAAKILGLDLAGDLKDRTRQALSDGKLREAQGLIRSIRNSAEVKDQDRVTRHLDEAISQLDIALTIR
jgi:hypothetical protein